MPAADSPVYRISGLGRPLDPRHPTNRWVVRLLPVLFLAGTGWLLHTGSSPAGAAGGGLATAMAAFLGWALTRELAPDDERIAFVGLALGALARLWLGPQSLLVPAVLLLSTRVVNRSAGKASEVGDTLVLTLGLSVVAWRTSWTLGLVGAAAFGADALLSPAPGQRARHDHWIAAIIVAASTVGSLYAGPRLVLDERWTWVLPLAAAGVLAAVVRPHATCVGDVDRVPLDPRRVLWATMIGIAGVTLASFDPVLGIRVLPATWGAVVAAVAAELARRARFRRS